MDSQRSFFVESGRRTTRYIRVVRIGFVKPFDGRDVVLERPLLVNYVTFEPLMLSSGGIFGIPLFETMAQTMKRAIDWLQTVGPGQYVWLTGSLIQIFTKQIIVDGRWGTILSR